MYSIGALPTRLDSLFHDLQLLALPSTLTNAGTTECLERQPVLLLAKLIGQREDLVCLRTVSIPMSQALAVQPKYVFVQSQGFI